MTKGLIYTLTSFISCIYSFSTFAVAINQPINSNLLIERGIDPQVLNLSLSTYRQQVALTVDTAHTVEYQNKIDTINYKVLYDPFKSYGIDLRLQVSKQYSKELNESDISSYLDELMGIQLYLQADQLYDEQSFKIESQTEQSTVISFKFNRDAIPREIAFSKDFQGLVYITNQGLEKIVISNQHNFKARSEEVLSFKKEIYFQSVPLNGGYLVKSININMLSLLDDQPKKTTITGVVTSYRDKQDSPIFYSSGARKVPEDDPDYITYYVNLDRTFPIFGQEARRQGYDLPKPFGISVITMMQETVLHMNSFKLDGEDLGKLVGGDDAKVVNNSAVMLLRADMWLFPFLNVGVLMGKSQTKSDITLELFPENPIIGDYITINDAKSDSFIYGGGATVAGGYGDYFATVDMQYITSYTPRADTEITMSIITPMVGYHFKEYGFRGLVGAQYQDTKETIVANFSGKEVVVGVSSEKWAGLLGVEKSFDRNWSSSLMVSYGEDRSNLNLVVGYRF